MPIMQRSFRDGAAEKYAPRIVFTAREVVAHYLRFRVFRCRLVSN